ACRAGREWRGRARTLRRQRRGDQRHGDQHPLGGAGLQGWRRVRIGVGRGREPDPPEQGPQGGPQGEGCDRNCATGFERPRRSRRRLAFSPMPFELGNAPPPAGDQPRAIRELTDGLARGDKYQTLLGVTGSGKTMTMAHVVANFRKPTLVLSHNKTLAAQLYGELKAFFPSNAVEFFISYYDYYQPEAYVPATDTYIAKDSSINDDIDALRLRATSSLMERDDVIIVASVSAIYGLGDPTTYKELLATAAVGEARARDALLQALVSIQYARNDVALERGTFRVRGDTVEVFPAYDEQGVRIELWGDTVERIAKFDPLT